MPVISRLTKLELNPMNGLLQMRGNWSIRGQNSNIAN